MTTLRIVPVVLALLAGGWGAGCSGTVVSIESYRSHEAFSDASHERFRAVAAERLATKADALEILGPPNHVLGQADGDVFVYRRVARDRRILNLDPALLYWGAAPPIPLYYGSFSSSRADVLMVFFDADGRMRAQGARRGIAP